MRINSSWNNFQTLDISHYFVFYPDTRNKAVLHGDCVPWNLNPGTLAEISDLAIELNPKTWRKRSALVERYSAALQEVEKNYPGENMKGKGSNRLRVVRKLYRSLLFFRSSLQGVEYAHSVGLIHRDLKPANIFMRVIH